MNPHNESPISSKGTERAPEKTDSSLDRSSANLQAEASPAMGDLNAMIVQKRQESKAQRNERLSSQFRKTGEAAVGEITRQFGCSIELSDKRKGAVVVAGRSSEDLAKLEELKSAANSDSLIGKGGAIVPPEENRALIGPKDGQSRDAQQLYDENTGEIHIGKRTYSRDQVVADTSQGTASDASRSNLKHDFMLYPGDSRFNYPDGVDYIVRNDRTIDKSTMENILVRQLMKPPISLFMQQGLGSIFLVLVMCNLLDR